MVAWQTLNLQPTEGVGQGSNPCGAAKVKEKTLKNPFYKAMHLKQTVKTLSPTNLRFKINCRQPQPIYPNNSVGIRATGFYPVYRGFESYLGCQKEDANVTGLSSLASRLCVTNTRVGLKPQTSLNRAKVGSLYQLSCRTTAAPIDRDTTILGIRISTIKGS